MNDSSSCVVSLKFEHLNGNNVMASMEFYTSFTLRLTSKLKDDFR